MQRNDEPGNPTSGREFDTEDFAGTSEERGEPDPLFALRYRLESELGCGGMGTVFRAWDTFLDVPVALKSLHWDKQHHEAANHVLRRELLSARLVTHRNVCRVYDSGCDQTKGTDRWFLTMEFLPGQTLRQRLAALGPMTAREALPIVTQLVDGLAAAHGAGVAHLDLKTANVMLSPEPHGAERVVIMDFGIAKLSANLVPMVRDRHEERSRPEPRRSFGGTPGYMAPEQSRGSHVGPHSDIYALGVVLHELRTGRLPGDTSEASLEPEWKVVIDRCLSEDPKDRFGRVQDVAHALGCGSVPPSFTAVTPTRSIPSELDPFVGRSQELVTIDGWLSSGNRLVTILGPAGIGKTRLAIHYSNSRKSAWEGGVWFVDLSAADESTLAVTIAHGIGIEPKSGDPVAAVGRALATRGRALVVLDNVDALVIPCGALLRGWFDSTDASFLATSREVLALRGEQVLSVDPLDTDQAIELFVDRARRSYPGFSPSEEDTSIVRRIVQLVDHLPLAIELAASRVRVVGLLGLESRLEDRLKVLTSRGGDRHSSLRGAIDASWDLLDASERMAWTQCAVFEGGFQLEDAEAVLDLGDDGPWVVDAIQSLVDKSLIRAGIPRLQSEPSAYRAVRFGMFPSLRQYALEKLAALGDDAVCSAKAAHMRHFARLSALPTEPDTVMEMLQRQVDDVENYTSAFRTALELADDQCAAELTFAMTGLLMRRGIGGVISSSVLYRSARAPSLEGACLRS